MKFKDIEFRGMSEIYGKDAKIGGVDLSNGLSGVNHTAQPILRRNCGALRGRRLMGGDGWGHP